MLQQTSGCCSLGLKAMSASVLIHCYGSTDMHIQGAHHSALWNLHAAVQHLHTKHPVNMRSHCLSMGHNPRGFHPTGKAVLLHGVCACFWGQSSPPADACHPSHLIWPSRRLHSSLITILNAPLQQLTCRIWGGIPLRSLPSTSTVFCGKGKEGSGLDSTVCSKPTSLHQYQDMKAGRWTCSPVQMGRQKTGSHFFPRGGCTLVPEALLYREPLQQNMTCDLASYVGHQPDLGCHNLHNGRIEWAQKLTCSQLLALPQATPEDLSRAPPGGAPTARQSCSQTGRPGL